MRIIRTEDGHDTLLVNGHSTGALISALWADRVRGTGVLQGLFLNSPFVEFNESWAVRHLLTPVISAVGARRPKAKLPQELGTTYGISIHRDHHGEWSYDLGVEASERLPHLRGLGTSDAPGPQARPGRTSPSTYRSSWASPRAAIAAGSPRRHTTLTPY